MHAKALVYLAISLLTATPIAAAQNAPRPSVRIGNGSFIGLTDGLTNSYRGIKFAEAPRFNLPVLISAYNNTFVLDDFGPACPQQPQFPPRPRLVALAAPSRESEDCLNLNVWVPSGTKPAAKLPVVAWIFGGAFEEGWNGSEDGGVVVNRSTVLKEPVIYVSMNYRVSAYGFLAGSEVKAAGIGNVGLEDQRTALRWIQKFIGAFGGDPARVTIGGASAGAISVSLQMLHNGGNTEGLFHGAFMQSGAPTPVGDISHGQSDYDTLVAETSCQGMQDTLGCLRRVPFDTLKRAVDNSPNVFGNQSLHLAWLPRNDGRFLLDNPQRLVLNGSVARIPYITGSCEDEGTIFSISITEIISNPIVNDSDFRAYILSNYIAGANESTVGNLFELYPDRPAEGSPFGTGDNFTFRQYKRLAAIQGDLIFQAPRRFFLEHTFNRQPSWSYLSRRNKTEPEAEFGAYHGTDAAFNLFQSGDLTDYIVHFVNHGDPNAPARVLAGEQTQQGEVEQQQEAGPAARLIAWPQWTNQTRRQLTFQDDANARLVVTNDTYRQAGFAKLTELSLRFPL